MLRIVSAALPALSFILASGVYAQATGVPPGPPIVEATIINDSSNPVPVTGDVNATIEGDIEVSGSVEVESVPQSVLNKLDRLIDAINAQPQPAGFREFYELTIDANDFVRMDFTSSASPKRISTLIISTENDSAEFFLCGEAAISGVCEEEVLGIGQDDMTWPHTLVVNLTRAVSARGFQIQCENNVEDCEFKVNFIGEDVDGF